MGVAGHRMAGCVLTFDGRRPYNHVFGFPLVGQ